MHKQLSSAQKIRLFGGSTHQFSTRMNFWRSFDKKRAVLDQRVSTCTPHVHSKQAYQSNGPIAAKHSASCYVRIKPVFIVCETEARTDLTAVVGGQCQLTQVLSRQGTLHDKRTLGSRGEVNREFATIHSHQQCSSSMREITQSRRTLELKFAACHQFQTVCSELRCKTNCSTFLLIQNSLL